jgi:hypothetical protein
MRTTTQERPVVQQRHAREQERQAPARWTVSWGWFTAPRFGAAGSGGLEYEPLPIRRKDAA